MAAPLPFSESELRLLQVLLKRKVRFMIVGLSAATLQGAPVVTQDVDLWFENLGEPREGQADDSLPARRAGRNAISEMPDREETKDDSLARLHQKIANDPFAHVTLIP